MESLRQRIAHLILSWPGLCLWLSCGLVCMLAPGLGWLTMDFGIRIWLPRAHPLMAPLDRFEKNFGNDEAVVVAVSDANGLFNPRTLQLIHDLTDHLERIDGVQRVDSLTNHQMVYGSEEAITVEAFLAETQELAPQQLAAKRTQALRDEVMAGYLLDPRARTTLLYAWLQPSLEREPNYRQIVHDVRQRLAPYQHLPGLTLHITGAGALNDAFRSASEKDLKVIFPLLAGVICLMLWGLYRRLTVAALPLLLILMTNLIVFGVLGYAGIALNNMLSVVPLVIVAIAIADSIHVINDMARYMRDGFEREPALRQAVEENLLPTALTSATTAMGFAGLLSTPIVPIQHLALTAALASLMAWALTFTFVVPLLRMLPTGWTIVPPRQHQGDRLDRFLHGYSGFLETYRHQIFVAGLLVAVVGVYVTAQVRIDSEPNAYFAEHVPIKRANDFVSREIGGFNGPEIVLDSGAPGGAKEPEFLRKVEALETWIDSHPYVNQTISIIDIVKSVHRAFHADDPQFYALASSPEVIAQELFVYSMGLSEGRSLDDLLDVQEQQTRLSVYWRLTKSRESLDAVAAIQDKMTELGLSGHVTGKYFILYRLNTFVVRTLLRSLAISFILVAAIMLLLFRSLRLGVGALAANLIPVLIGGIVVVICGKTVNFATAMVVSICLGIAVDDTIHFCSAYFRYQASARSHRELLYHVFRSTGHALGITTLLLVTGFGAFVFGDFIPNVELGIFCCTVLIAALVTDLLWLPCMLSFFRFRQAPVETAQPGVAQPSAPSGRLARLDFRG